MLEIAIFTAPLLANISKNILNSSSRNTTPIIHHENTSTFQPDVILLANSPAKQKPLDGMNV